ncbi:MAG: glycosyltransferase family 4 protein [Vicinamibacterales bacterium]|nr:glycosyl transferase family 1 [Acidobacteriota bacterium]MDP7295073.1 glycosyltransferase family 4 protein [Vicinamibacterales bacterium]MDP7471133.1 glycosyltransferase family 4 protein [Vicinamibacterales bacterium]MDP7671739.1 glycosyltransferase family 4 protein [Vicinamibacterales bacterium]HJO39551.1 glycosyltransferase family 4 protein [Vicinamibacterales bacterium]
MRPEDLHVIVLARAVYPLHPVGGLERHVYDLVRHLLKRSVRVTVVTRPPRDGAGELPGDVETGRLEWRFVPYWTFPFAGRRGTTILDRISAYPYFGWRAGRVAADLVRQGGVHVVHGLGASVFGYAWARRRDRLGTVPLIFNPQGLEEFGATDPSRAPLKVIAYRPLQMVVRACASAADRIIATDRSLRPTVLAHLGVPDRRVSVVPNAVDLDACERLAGPDEGRIMRSDLGVGADEAVLLSVARLEQNKGLDVLARALARVAARASTGAHPPRPWRWVLIGDGPDRSRLTRLVGELGLGSRTTMLGRVSDATLHAWYEAATLFVHPTLYEGSSLVTLEAMAHRRPVVATRAGGLPDKVVPGETGWLVSPGDAEALADALAEALALSATDGLAKMGAAGRELVERSFSWDAVTDRLLALYAEVLGQRADPASRG